MGVSVNEGTQTIIASVTNAGTQYQVVKLDTGSGTALQDFGGTLAAVNNLANGTVRISVGTITAGTVDSLNIGRRHADEFATVVTSGTSTLGTIKAPVAGSVIYVTNIVISVGSASNVVIASGGTSTPIGGTFFFNANGGLVNGPIDPPWRTANGSALVYQQSANGPMSLTVTGYTD